MRLPPRASDAARPASLFPAMPSSAPTVGFVSLGCPKALVDSERILTQLRSDGYSVVPTYDDADIVVVNTCGFIDAAVEESLGAIGEALDENGRVVVTGCLGVKPDEIRARYPKVLAITGPQAYESVVAAVHEHAPNRAPHDPFVDLVPPPRGQAHTAPLRVPEDLRRLRSQVQLLHHPVDARAAREPRDRRRAGRGRAAARRRRPGAARHQPGHLRLRGGPALPHRLPRRPARQGEVPGPVPRARRARHLGAAALRLPVPARRSRDAADGRRPAAAVPRHPVPSTRAARC